MRISPSGSLTNAQVLSTVVNLPLLSVRSTLPMLVVGIGRIAADEIGKRASLGATEGLRLLS